MSKDLKNVASVSLTTILSRITGLLRDVLIFAALGASAWSSAFIVGFTIPNLFRRLFGEGALSSAFIPIFSTIIENLKKSIEKLEPSLFKDNGDYVRSKRKIKSILKKKEEEIEKREKEEKKCFFIIFMYNIII